MTLGGVGHVQRSEKNKNIWMFLMNIFFCVPSFHDFNEILNEILSVVFLDIKKTR